ncbi:MAG: hypothetical protein M3Q45_12025, partial [Chloroflexota bacterium]|nr:hypothetical protein [Chloroflexota bacterium]
MGRMIPSRVHKVGLRVTLLLVLLATFALRLHALTRQDIWWDEARNLDVALRPLRQIATAPELDIQPPFYFWLLHGWSRLAGVSTSNDPALLAFVVRFLSVSAGLVGTRLLLPLGRLAVSRLAGFYAVVLGGLSPFWLAESQETRMYTLGFALLTGAAVGLLREIGKQRLVTDEVTYPITNRHSLLSKQHNLLLFVILSTLALLTHYNALFILIAWYGWWGGWTLWQADRRRQMRRVLLCGLATALLIAPLAPIALRQIPTYANPNLTVPTLRAYLWQNWQAYLGGYAFDPALLNGNGLTWLWISLGLLITGLALAMVHQVQPGESGSEPYPVFRIPYPIFLLVWLCGGLALYYIAVLDRGAFNVRYSSFVTPALYVSMGMACTGWGRLWRPLGMIGLVVVSIGMLPALRADLYDERFAREDITGVRSWLRQTAGADDLILVDQKYPFGFYYQRYAVDPSTTPQGLEAAPARYLFVDINTLDQQLNAWAGSAQRIFWVQWFESDTDPRHAVRFLLNKAGHYAGTQGFHGYSVEW